MYRVELIPKTSTLNDIIEPWVCSGRVDNRADGVFVFEDCDKCLIQEGAILIAKGNKNYAYNLISLRVNLTKQLSDSLFAGNGTRANLLMPDAGP